MNQERGKLKKILLKDKKYVENEINEILRIKSDSRRPYDELRVIYAKLNVWEKTLSMINEIIETCESRNKF